jgi:hypothetical protein
MKIDYTTQRTDKWLELKRGRIGGTRFGQVISGKKNRLVYELLNERLPGWLIEDDYVSEEMQFGIDNELTALEAYTQATGIKVEQVGAILSDFSDIHLASPDGINIELGIVQEVKCTMDGAIHLQRYFEGVETSYLPQIINYFAVSDEVKQVDWISYCPYRPERPIVIISFTRATLLKEGSIQSIVEKGRGQVKFIETQLDQLQSNFIF